MDNIVFYHQKNCGMCRAVEMQLNKHGIKYDSIDSIEDMKKLGIMHTPVLEVNGERLEGTSIMNWIKSNSSIK